MSWFVRNTPPQNVLEMQRAQDAEPNVEPDSRLLDKGRNVPVDSAKAAESTASEAGEVGQEKER